MSSIIRNSFQALTLVLVVSLAAGCSMKGKTPDDTSAKKNEKTEQPKSAFTRIFSNKKPIIAVINLQTLPGQKDFKSMDDVIKQSMDQLIMLEEEGVDGAIFENNQGDFEGTPEMIAAMTVIMHEAARIAKTVQLGVEVLWHDPKASFAIARATGAKFIRTDFFVDEMKADDRVIKVDIPDLMKYRNMIGADDVAIFTDVQVKYAEMIDPSKTIEQSALEARQNGSNGVIVTGRKSGVPPDAERVRNVKKGAGDLEVILGSGTNYQNAPELLSIADGAIVGTSISTGTGGILIREKVRQFMDVVKTLR